MPREFDPTWSAEGDNMSRMNEVNSCSSCVITVQMMMETTLGRHGMHKRLLMLR